MRKSKRIDTNETRPTRRVFYAQDVGDISEFWNIRRHAKNNKLKPL